MALLNVMQSCLYRLQASVHVSQVTVEDAVMNVRKTTLAIPRCIAFVSIKWDNWIRNCLNINAYLLYSQGIHAEKRHFIYLCVWDGQVFIFFIYIVISMVKVEVRDEEEPLLCSPPCSNQTLVCFYYLEMHLLHALIPQKRKNWM